MKKTIILLVLLGTTSAFAGWNNSQKAKCTDRMDQTPNLPNTVGSSLKVECPKNCLSGAVYGDGVYTIDSAVCVAAVHAGVITAAKGGAVTIKVVPSLPSYQGSEKNGVTTQSWANSWGETAFTVE